MSLLIAVKSCERDALNGNNNAVRETWAKYFEGRAGIKFFIGRGSAPLQHDEIRVDAPDDYNGLPWKTKNICSWAIEHNYDHIFLCDTDTFVRPELLLTGFQQWDYCGFYHDRNIAGRTFEEFRDDRGQILRNGHWWASGGIGYFLSQRAARAVANSEPTHWAEDLWVGQVIGPYVQRQEMTTHAFQAYLGIVVWHFCASRQHRQFDKSWLYEAYKHGVPAW